MQTNVDVLVDDDGDLVVDETGDLQLATPLETCQQDVLFRIKTAHHDYEPDPFLGANLGKYKGKSNTRRTGDYMKADLHEALVRDGRFSRGSIVVDCVPYSRTGVALVVFLKEAIEGTEQDVHDRMGEALVSVYVDLETGQISTIAGGLR